MYNRYIPQPDGSYRRNRMPDQHNPRAPSPPPVREQPQEKQEGEHMPATKPKMDNNEPVLGFLKQLLPKNMDTGDLIIILLLLLIAGDSEENRNNALLTLALYFLL